MLEKQASLLDQILVSHEPSGYSCSAPNKVWDLRFNGRDTTPQTIRNEDRVLDCIMH